MPVGDAEPAFLFSAIASNGVTDMGSLKIKNKSSF